MKLNLGGITMIAAMLLVAIVSTGTTLMYKFAHKANFNMSILVTYRYIVALIVTGIFALILERKSREETPFTRRILGLGILCGFLNAAMENFTAESYSMSSAASIGAISNMSPALTFIIAAFCRIERLNYKNWAGKAKIAGTVISIAGGLTSCFYLGTTLPWSIPANLVNPIAALAWSDSSNQTWLGIVLNIAGCICSTLTLLVFSRLSRDYPRLSSTWIMCTFTTVFSAVYSLIRVHKDWEEWEITQDLSSLIPILYTGLLSTALNVAIVAWCARAKGPVFVSSFSPAGLVFNMLLGWALFGEHLRSGSILGGGIIVMGVGLVLWGQNQEANIKNDDVPSHPPTANAEPDVDIEGGTVE